MKIEDLMNKSEKGGTFIYTESQAKSMMPAMKRIN